MKILKKKHDINYFLSKFLKLKRPYERLDIITKSILIVATSEIIYNKKLNKNIIVNDYVEITKSFFSKREVSLNNAILDNFYDSEHRKK